MTDERIEAFLDHVLTSPPEWQEEAADIVPEIAAKLRTRISSCQAG